MAHQGYGFCEFLTEEDAEYACKIMNQIKLWGKPIRVNKVRGVLHRICVNAQTPPCHVYFLFHLLTFSLLGLFRQKTTGRWRKPLHWQPRRKR